MAEIARSITAFQSTPLCEGRRRLLALDRADRRVSIHAPL